MRWDGDGNWDGDGTPGGRPGSAARMAPEDTTFAVLVLSVKDTPIVIAPGRLGGPGRP